MGRQEPETVEKVGLLRRLRRRTVRLLLWLVGGALLGCVLYFLVALVLGLIPCNSGYEPPPTGIHVYVITNGIHADFVLPVRALGKDWTKVLPLGEFENVWEPIPFISFGWGDRSIYLETPTWGDLKISTALSATLLPTATVMHVAYLWWEPKQSDSCVKLTLTAPQYEILVKHIEEGFAPGSDGRPVLIPGKGYQSDANDNFYEGSGSYSLFRTCNNWTNEGLKKVGVTTACWAPFDVAIFHHLAHLAAREGK